MLFETWLAFVVASIAVLAVPGPVVALTVSRVAGHGWMSAAPLAAGATLGDAFAMTLSLAGAGAVLTASSEAFAVLKIIGSGYLIWLGISALRKFRGVVPIASVRAGSLFRDAFLVTAFHPGGFVFFVAFVPLFIDQTRALLPQILLLEATFVTLTAANVLFWAAIASKGRRMATHSRWSERVETLSGAVMIGLGILGGVDAARKCCR